MQRRDTAYSRQQTHQHVWLQVIKDRKWKEITGVFNFPRTTTSASYVLRKYYITLLHHYEQAYFFGATGYLIPPPSNFQVPE